MRKVNLGLIGLGYIGKIHLRHSLALNAGDVAVSDISRKSLSYAKSLGVKKRKRDYQELLNDPEIDAVIISLPTHLHKNCAIEAAEAGKDILLEKPLAINPQDGKEIVHTTDKNGSKLMTGYHLRFHPEFRSLKNQIIDGSLGDVQTSIASFVGAGPFLMHRADGHSPRPVPAWWFDKNKTGGGALTDLGCHLINLLHWYFGECRTLDCHLGYRYKLDLEDYAICKAIFEKGQVAIVNVGWFSLGYHLSIDLFGTAGIASAESKPSNKIAHAVQLLTGKSSRFHLPHYWEIEYFVDCIKNDVMPSPSGRDGLRDLEFIAKAYVSGARQIHES